MAVADAGLGSRKNVFRRSDPTRLALSPRAATGRDPALDYLRAVITVLVVAHHSVLAYALISPNAAPRHPLHPWLAGIPIADSHRLVAFDLFGLFNDTFFMSLMFLLSGLFVWPSMARKGGARFLLDRVLRLGVPFGVLALLAPVAYYAAYRVTAPDPSVPAFWRDWLSLGLWPSGPVWFISVLLVFDGIAAGIHRFTPSQMQSMRRRASVALRYLVALFAALMLLSAMLYLPLRVVFGADSWVTIGPFSLQSSRALHYLLYFLAGVAVGACDVDVGLLGRLARHWSRWTLAALALFAAYVALIVALGPSRPTIGLAPLARQLILGIGFVLCCGAISFAMLAVCRRFINAPTQVLDSFSRNAYGIYLVHYGFVLWLQSALLPAPLPAAGKAAIVLIVGLSASCATTAGLRRIPVLARVL
jgi:hypothetical protein